MLEPGVTTATKTSRGIRITLTAESSQFSSDDGLWVTTRLQNVGKDVLHWGTDACAIHVSVGARTGLEWAYGAEQFGTFRVFKDWALEHRSFIDHHPIALRTTPDWALDLGEFGCPDVGVGHDLEPGGRIDARELVEADDGMYGLPPAGPILLSGTFGSWHRGNEDGDAVHHDPVVVTLGVELTEGRDPALISPGQAVDVALGSPELASALRRHPEIHDFTPVVLRYEAADERWRVGITLDEDQAESSEGRELGRQLVVIVNARSATVIEVGEEPYPKPPA